MVQTTTEKVEKRGTEAAELMKKTGALVPHHPDHPADPHDGDTTKASKSVTANVTKKAAVVRTGPDAIEAGLAVAAAVQLGMVTAAKPIAWHTFQRKQRSTDTANYPPK